MLRGISRMTVEVSGTGSRYFERAIIFVRPQYVRERRLDLHREAKRMIDRLEYCVDRPEETDGHEERGRASRLPRLLALTASALAGAAAGAAIVTYL